MKRQNKEFVCEKCQKQYYRLCSDKTHIPKRTYCSVTCKREDKNSYLSEWTQERRKRISEQTRGINNPNYNNKWSEERKSQFSDYKKKFYKENPDVAFSCGKSNRGVKFGQDRIDRMHKHRTRESYCRPHSDESKLAIGKKSKEKWTDSYKEKHKNKMISLGYWVDPKDNPYKLYYREANWCENMISYFSSEEMEIFKKVGFYNKFNSSGYVRDHKVSRKKGFTFGLPYYIIRHPANLQLIRHGENVSKGFKERSMTHEESALLIENLLDDIQNYKKDWCEQSLCLKFIKERRSV